MGRNRSELIKALENAGQLSEHEAADVVHIFFDKIRQALSEEGGRVEIRGFGSFKMKKYGGYKGRNPKSGESVIVEPKTLPVFRPGKELKEILNKA